ncbi:MAG: CheR family methyltransferase [Candidatus Binatia bacterium]
MTDRQMEAPTTPLAPAETDGLSPATGEPVKFPIVAIGASAGGLEALKRLFTHTPADSGMAFVVILHLDPERPSMLTNVLEGVTKLPVVEVTSGMPAEPNRVHVIPSNSDLSIRRGILSLVPRQLTGRLHLPIDSFFRELADNSRDGAIGVVLSGSGADGTEGLRAIKAAGGIAMVQEPDSAQFSGMPERALAGGAVDFQGTPEMIAGEIERLSRHPYVVARSLTRGEGEPQEPGPELEKSLAAIFSLVRRAAGSDFSFYKRTTALRRIDRRMALRRTDGLEAYANALRDDPGEARALAEDMLIHVTSFFRDPEAFVALKQLVFEEFAHRDGTSIRIWVPGCSTGEEVYSLAICLFESLDSQADRFSIKIFGTDLSTEAVDEARVGRYSESALVGVNPDRLSRYFDRVEGGYQIGKRIRDVCIFVKHDLVRDPPFAKLDLISCRNVLIYFDADLQRKVLSILHHCLKPKGYLFLGESETITSFRENFAVVDAEHRIFTKTGKSLPLIFPHSYFSLGSEERVSEGRLVPRHRPALDAQRQADLLLLARYSPPGVVVNDRLEVIQFRGRTGQFLEQPPGLPQANLLRMAREDLAAHLHEVVERAKSEAAPVRKEGCRIEVGSKAYLINLEVMPLTGMPDSDRYFLVLFEDTATPPAATGVRPAGRQAEPEPPMESITEILRLRADLVATKDYLQSLVAENQVSTDDLAATNEEMLAANEELQSTNEELQSAKEELQSANEELSTVNDQLQNRNRELDEVASDLVNVLSSVDIPVIIVDRKLRVRRFTPSIRDIAGFIPGDLGRPLDDLKLKLNLDDVVTRIRDVIDGNSSTDWEVQRHDGHHFRMQIRPYYTTDHRLDGAVVAFVDIDVLKEARRAAEISRDYARSLVEAVSTALVVLDSDLRVVSANNAFFRIFTTPADKAEGRSLFDVCPALRAPMQLCSVEESIQKHTEFSDIELTAEFGNVGRRILRLVGRRIAWVGGESMMLLGFDDMTDLRVLEAERALLLASEKQARLDAERANRAKDLFLATLSHELRTPLSTMLMSAQLLRLLATEDPRIERASASIERATKSQAKLIDDLLDVSRVVSGKLLLDLSPVNFAAVVENAVEIAQPMARAKSLALRLVLDQATATVYGDETRLQQVVTNLLVNAIKFTPRDGHIAVHLQQQGEQVKLSVTDSGMGISPEVLPQLFNRFVQADSSVTRTHGGLGLGLSIVRHLVEAHGGTVEVESPGEGKGATFRVTLPVGSAERSMVPVAPRANVRPIQGARVLLIEDDDDTRETYASMLGEFGAEVRAEPSAAAGFLALEEFRPQVILSDIAMPGEDGYSFIRRVRSLGSEQGGRVPAAALTALASIEDRQQALEAGFQMHVPKPVDAARLAAVVSALMDWWKPPTRPGSTSA